MTVLQSEMDWDQEKHCHKMCNAEKEKKRKKKKTAFQIFLASS